MKLLPLKPRMAYGLQTDRRLTNSNQLLLHETTTTNITNTSQQRIYRSSIYIYSWVLHEGVGSMLLVSTVSQSSGPHSQHFRNEANTV